MVSLLVRRTLVVIKHYFPYVSLGTGSLIRVKLQHDPEGKKKSFALKEDAPTLKGLPDLSNL